MDRPAQSLVSPTPATRALGLAGVLGGAWLVAWLVPVIPSGPNGFNLRLLAFNIGAIAVVVALSRPLGATSARLDRAILVAAVVANAWYLAMLVLGIGRAQPPEPDPDFRLVMFWAGVAMWWADAAFGVMALRLDGIARWGALALAFGSVLAFLGIDRLGLVAGPYQALVIPLALAGVILNGIAWILLGIDVAVRPRPVAAAS